MDGGEIISPLAFLCKIADNFLLYLFPPYLIIGLLLQAIPSGVGIARRRPVEHPQANAEVGEGDDGHRQPVGDDEDGQREALQLLRRPQLLAVVVDDARLAGDPEGDRVRFGVLHQAHGEAAHPDGRQADVDEGAAEASGAKWMDDGHVSRKELGLGNSLRLG